MPRKPSVRWFDSKKGYYATINGHRTRLGGGPRDDTEGPNYRAAVATWLRLTGADASGVGPDRNLIPVSQVWELYRRHLASNAQANTQRIRAQGLLPFVASFGGRSVSSLMGYEVELWLDEMRQPRKHPVHGRLVRWGQSTIRGAIVSIHAMFNWAHQGGLITKPPPLNLHLPPKRGRGAKTVVSESQYNLIKTKTTGDTRDFVIVLWYTGARPSEITNATAAHYDDATATITHTGQPEDDDYRHKNARHHRDRVIYLAGEALEIVRRRAEKYKTGPLFGTRGRHDKYRDVSVLRPWTHTHISQMFRNIRKRTGLPNVIAYSFRHSFVTRWVTSGRSVAVLADLLGTSPTVIRDNYSHLFEDKAALSAHVDDFFGLTDDDDGVIKIQRNGAERKA